MPKATEYHIKALDINTIFATAGLSIIPTFFENSVWSIKRLTI
jgi:hypothetical protein